MNRYPRTWLCILWSQMVLIGTSTRAEDAPDFKAYESKRFSYSVLLPATPEPFEFTSNLDLSKDEVSYSKVMSFTKDNGSFVVTTEDYVRAFGFSAKEEMLKERPLESKGTIVEDTKTTFGKNKWPARDLLLKDEAEYHRTRLIAKGSRLYQLRVTGTREQVQSKQADKFLASFQLK